MTYLDYRVYCRQAGLPALSEADWLREKAQGEAETAAREAAPVQPRVLADNGARVKRPRLVPDVRKAHSHTRKEMKRAARKAGHRGS
jgi:hypothetical protein